MAHRIPSRVQRGFLYFLLYSFIGWVYEVFLEVVVYRWGYADRGVLFGPYCPVYGVGALLFVLCFGRLMARSGSPAFRALRVVGVFLGCMLTATALELATSYLLEALTGSWPWQTYVNYRIQFQGRIALSPSIRFGLGGLVCLYLLHPLLRRLMGALPDRTRSTVFWVVLLAFLLDNVLTILTHFFR